LPGKKKKKKRKKEKKRKTKKSRLEVGSCGPDPKLL
jgi:hypothetical protein